MECDKLGTREQLGRGNWGPDELFRKALLLRATRASGKKQCVIKCLGCEFRAPNDFPFSVCVIVTFVTVVWGEL